MIYRRATPRPARDMPSSVRRNFTPSDWRLGMPFSRTPETSPTSRTSCREPRDTLVDHAVRKQALFRSQQSLGISDELPSRP